MYYVKNKNDYISCCSVGRSKKKESLLDQVFSLISSHLVLKKDRLDTTLEYGQNKKTWEKICNDLLSCTN